MATTAEINSFIKTLGTLAVNESNRRIANGEGFVLPSVCIAQSAIETGWGTAGIMVKANAFFGIKAGGSWTGKVYRADTWEVADGSAYNTTANFRAYDSLEDSVRDYYDLILNNKRYAGGVSYFPVDVLSARATITAIWSGGYATDTLYVEKIMSTINSRNLTTWDNEIDGISTASPDDYVDEITLDETNLKQGLLYVNNGREVLLNTTATNVVSLLWENAIPMNRGKYRITVPEDYTLRVVTWTGGSSAPVQTDVTTNTWTNDGAYSSVAFSIIGAEGSTLTVDDIISEGVNAVMETPTLAEVNDSVFAYFVKIE